MRPRTAVLLLLTTLLALPACDRAAPPPPATPAAPVSSAAREALVPGGLAPPTADRLPASLTASLDALNAHDARGFASRFAPDGIRRTFSTVPDAIGRDAIAADAARTFASFPDYKVALSHVFEKGNVCIAIGVMNGTDTGGFMGARPTGRPAGVDFADVFWFGDDGLIKELHAYANTATILKQLGLLESKGPATAPPPLPTSIEIVRAGASQEDGNLEGYRAMWKSWDDHQLDAYVSYYGTDVQSVLHSARKSLPLDEIRASQAAIWTAMPDARAPASSTWAIGDYVFVEALVAGTFKERLASYEPTGKVVSWHILSAVRWKDGRIVGDDTWGSGTEFLAQVGALKLQAP